MTMRNVFHHNHEKISDLISRLDHSETRMDLTDTFRQLSDELESHTETIADYYYAALKHHSESRALLQEIFDEHGRLDKLVADVEAHVKADEAWHARLQQLQGRFEAHVVREENELFPRLEEMLEEESEVTGSRAHFTPRLSS